jgi:hypothetical protein
MCERAVCIEHILHASSIGGREGGCQVSNLAIKCATYRRSNDGRKSCLLEPPITRKPRRYQADVDQVARFICHANSTHVLQSLWRGLRRATGASFVARGVFEEGRFLKSGAKLLNLGPSILPLYQRSFRAWQWRCRRTTDRDVGSGTAPEPTGR